jgi:putative ABC transport system ATP-binding protein
MISLQAVAKHFGEGDRRVDALRNISMAVNPGEIVGLVGPSGSGKSTLLNIIACILEPSEGRMDLDGEAIYDNRWLKGDLRRLRLDKIGFVFQFHNLLPFLSTIENVAMVRELAGATARESKARAIELLDYLGVAHRATAMPATISGGEAQRVAIARAIANRPRIILADEPTAALDSQRAGVVMDLLGKLAHEQRAAIVVVSHDEKIFDRFHRIFHLRDGYLESVDSRPLLFRPEIQLAPTLRP